MANENQVKEEEKPKQSSGLESLVTESSQALGGLANFALGSSLIAGTYLIGGADWLVTSAAFPIGRKIKDSISGIETKMKDYRNESIIGAAIAPPIWGLVNTIKQVPNAFGLDTLTGSFVVGGLTFGLLNPLINALYYPLDHLVKKRTFKGMGEYFKENYWKDLKRTFPLSALTSVAVGLNYALPAFSPYLFPFLAASSVLYKILLTKSEGKTEYKRLFYPSTYLPNSLNPFYLAEGAGKFYNRLLSGVYTLGRGINEFFTIETKAAPAASPAAAPAT